VDGAQGYERVALCQGAGQQANSVELPVRMRYLRNGLGPPEMPYAVDARMGLAAA